ncbi:MAG: DNA repair protein RecN [Proteobacteria bacterium]|nr:DNA repair protein RecN [Pseudomonadota bacterium]
MLISLQVRNFAIIDQAEVEFAPGMTVLTGETGAGKSILVDALGLVLGERGGTGITRTGTNRAEFTAEFDLQNLPDARLWLEEQMLDVDDACNLRRVINADGRSRAFINGNTVPLQSLKALGEMLLDIHGQRFHQSLGRREVQRNLLDYYGGLNEVRAKTETTFAEWQAVAAQIASLEAADTDRASRLELLQFQITELDALALDTDEIAALSQERQKLQNRGRLAESVTGALHRLYDGDPLNAQHLIAEAMQAIEQMCEIDPSLKPIASLLQDANIQVSEAQDMLRRYGDALDMDPVRQNWVEERLDAIYALARKHRVETAELADLHRTLRQQLDDLERAGEYCAKLADEVAVAEADFRNLAAQLSAGRKKAAGNFSSAVTGTMENLGMPGGVFEIRISPRDRSAPRSWGVDDIEFLISANPGQPLMPLSRIASGGELSRMSLSIQVIASDGSTIPTMIFDEIDSGIGGGVAEMVGLKLRELGETRQVVCVTHLPQVASLADHHFRIFKISDGKSTKTAVTNLGIDERVEELARMLGGVKITARTRDHAAEMLRLGSRTRQKKISA